MTTEIPLFRRSGLAFWPLLIAAFSMFTNDLSAVGIDYATTIQPIYTSLCMPCHSGSNPDAGLNLAVNSYANTVNVTGKQIYSTYRVRPNFATNALSAVYRTVVTQGSGANHNGLSWVASAADKSNITNWINQGALPNTNAPTVTSLSVTSGAASGGTAVTITGTNFGGTGAFVPSVTFGGVAATSVVVVTGSFTSITCTTPAHASGAVNVVVTTTAGGASAPLTNGFTYNSGTPTKLAFGTQPSTVNVGSAITPAVTVQIQDASGALTTSTASVTLALGNNPGGATLSGATVAAVNGTATFPNLILDRAGVGYTLTANSTGLTAATSNAFTVNGAAPTVNSPSSASISTVSATLGGNASADGGATITARGVVLAPTSVNSNPTIGGAGVVNVVAAAGGTGAFTVNATNLSPGTAYTFAAYATNSATTAYSATGTFTTISTDASLSSLAPSTGTLSPTFSSATLGYALTVPYSTVSLAVTPTVSSGLATVKVNGTTTASGSQSSSVNLSVGANNITILVTAQDNVTTQSYTITATRLPPSANLASLPLSTGTLSPAFDPLIITYTATVPYTVASMTFTPVTVDALATVLVNGNAASLPVSLVVGANSVSIVVTAQDNSTKTYSVTVTRAAPSTNANLASLAPSTGTLSPSFDAMVTAYSFDVPYAIASLTVTPTVADTTATVQINGSTVATGTASGLINLSEGPNTITTLVTAQDSSTKTYTITVTRASGGTVATLASLVPNVGALSPAFASGTFGYSLRVPLATTSMTFTPSLSVGIASLQLNGSAISDGSAANVSLSPGSNIFNFVVTSADTAHTATYVVTVSRIASSNADLASLTPDSGTLSPSFNAGTTSYTMDLPNSTKTLSLTPVVADATATFTVNGLANAPIALVEGDNTLQVNVTAQDATVKLYTVIVRRAFSGAPRIVTQPASQIVGPMSRVTFQVTAVGAATLSYQWKKNGVIVPSATTDALRIPLAQASDKGSYTVVVSNSIGSVTSDAATLTVLATAATGVPQITTQPHSALVPMGQVASFSGVATGATPLTTQWMNGAKAVPLTSAGSATSPVTVGYTTPPTTLLSAGTYSIQAKNAQGTVLSAGARLGVVDRAKKTVLAKATTTATLSVSAAGDGLLYRWKKDGVEIADSTVGTHIVSGTGTAALTIKGSTLADTGGYTCLVRMGALTLESGVTSLKVYDKAPIIQLAANSALPNAIVSGNYNDGNGHPFVVPVDTSSDRAVVSFSQVGLPTTMKLDPVTGVISGKPTVATPVGNPLKVTITATNGVNKASVVVQLTILPLPTGSIGTFNGLVDRDASTTNGLSLDPAKTLSFGGSLNIVTSSTGGFSGKLTLGTLSYPITGQSLNVEIGKAPGATVVFKRSLPLHDLSLTFAIKSTGELNGTVTDGFAPPVNVQAWSHTTPPAALLGSYTAVLDFTPGQVPDPTGDLAFPQGYGFGTLTVTATGATWAGQLADGSVVTTNTTVGSTGQIPLHLQLYTAAGLNPGSVHGWLQLSADNANLPINGGQPYIDAALDWVKPVQPAASTNHNYKAGFPLHKITLAGGKFNKPTGIILSPLTDGGAGTTDAKLTFSDGGLTGPPPIVGASLASALNATPFRISTANAVTVPANPATLSFNLTPATGAFNGKFVLSDPDPTVHTGTVPKLTRSSSYGGVIVTRVGINKGVGNFLLSKLPADATANTPKTTLSNSDILSGSVELGAK